MFNCKEWLDWQEKVQLYTLVKTSFSQLLEMQGTRKQALWFNKFSCSHYGPIFYITVRQALKSMAKQCCFVLSGGCTKFLTIPACVSLHLSVSACICLLEEIHQFLQSKLADSFAIYSSFLNTLYIFQVYMSFCQSDGQKWQQLLQ